MRKLMRFVEYDGRLRAPAEHPRFLATLERFMGDTPVLFQDQALLKPPLVGREKPWHQDNAYFNLPPETVVVAPGSHSTRRCRRTAACTSSPAATARGRWSTSSGAIGKSATPTCRPAGSWPCRSSRGLPLLPRPAAPRHAAQPVAAPSPRAAVPLQARQCGPDRRGGAPGGLRQRRQGCRVLRRRLAVCRHVTADGGDTLAIRIAVIRLCSRTHRLYSTRERSRYPNHVTTVAVTRRPPLIDGQV